MTYRILVALDGSPASEAALQEIERIADGGAGVHFLRVVPLLPPGVGTSSAGVMACYEQALAYLGALREKSPDVRGLDLIRTDDPAGAILQVAIEFNIDLIAMGTHVRAGPEAWRLGSVAETVLHRSPLPVLLRRPNPLPDSKALRRILVPLDGSEESLTILPTAMRLALRNRAEVVFLHVSERAGAPLPPHGGKSGDPKEKILSLAERLERSELVFWQTVAEGDPVEEILIHAKTLDADLIAMTTQAVNGKQAMDVLSRADRAVLLQRPAAHQVVPRAPLMDWTS